MKIKKPVSAPETQRKIKRSYLTVATVAAAAIVMALPVYADDPLATINALSDFVFSAIKAIGAILLGFGMRPPKEPTAAARCRAVCSRASPSTESTRTGHGAAAMYTARCGPCRTSTLQ